MNFVPCSCFLFYSRNFCCFFYFPSICPGGTPLYSHNVPKFVVYILHITIRIFGVVLGLFRIFGYVFKGLHTQIKKVDFHDHVALKLRITIRIFGLITSYPSGFLDYIPPLHPTDFWGQNRRGCGTSPSTQRWITLCVTNLDCNYLKICH